MSAKQMKYEGDARQAILSGVSKLTKAVATTLGPSGRNVIIDKKFGSPQITKDGVTVAKEIELPDPFENMGAQMVREVASKTNDVAGDGTTTATILGEAIYREGLKNVTAGANPQAIKRGIDKAAAAATEAIAKLAKKVSTSDEIAQVATVCYQYGDVVTNVLTPLSAFVLTCLGFARVPFTKWIKFVFPLAVSHGAGANSQHAIGTGIIGGTFLATALGVFFIPVFFASRWTAMKIPRK